MARWTRIVTGLAAAATLAIVVVPVASAKDGDVRVAGKCTRASVSKLKLSPENGRIEVELEVDQNRNGVRWVVSLSQNGRKVFARHPRHEGAERLLRGAPARLEHRRCGRFRREGDEPLR